MRRKLVQDPYSGEMTQGSWADPDELAIEGASVAPSSTTEQQTSNRQTVITSMSVYGPPGMDVLPADRIRDSQGLWEVTGETAAWKNPFTGWRPGDELPVKKVVG
ncbi:hypothetical protein [Arthrobacter sp. lap29]|uniref:hypothetical protein n=1 Tax=Arthrobacter sp. lap29 TaxID=3056122 RepID=UPI0028F72C33|nr:hypothetical protein [Arthrobacter sp. lap29]